jgi:molecular chaperone GrpE (heat shock protein)
MIRRLALALFQLIRDRLVIFRLRRQIERAKLRNYDLLVENVKGLRRALETQERAAEALHRQIDEQAQRIGRLREEYAALERRQAEATKMAIENERLMLFKRLMPIMIQLSTLRAAIENGAEVPPRDMLDLLSPLNELLNDLGGEKIGEAGALVPFDSRHHRPVGRGARSIAAGEPVRIRYIGYKRNGQVIHKAEVTRVEQEQVTS